MYRLHGSGAFEFQHVDRAHIDMGRTFFTQARVLKPFGNVKPGDLLDGVSINPNSFECFYWQNNKFQERVLFNIRELLETPSVMKP